MRFDFIDHPEFRHNLWRVEPDGRIRMLGAREDRETDLRVRAPARTLAEIWLRRKSPGEAVQEGRLELKWDPVLTGRFGSWQGRNPYADEPT